MAKTYTAAGTVVAGDVYTAAAHNIIATDVNNFIVPPMVKCIRSNDLNLTSPTLIAWNGTDAFDTDAMHDPSTNNTRITFNTAGIYMVVFNAFVTISGTPSAHDYYITGGSASTVLAADFKATTAYTVNTNASCTLTTFVDSASYAYVEANVNFPSASVATLKNDARNSFSALWVGRTS
jgi:hypothetical protein